MGWGTDVQGTHYREGEAGHNVHLGGNMGDTLRSQTVLTKLQGIAEQVLSLQGSKVMRQTGSCLFG